MQARRLFGHILSLSLPYFFIISATRHLTTVFSLLKHEKICQLSLCKCLDHIDHHKCSVQLGTNHLSFRDATLLACKSFFRDQDMKNMMLRIFFMSFCSVTNKKDWRIFLLSFFLLIIYIHQVFLLFLLFGSVSLPSQHILRNGTYTLGLPWLNCNVLHYLRFWHFIHDRVVTCNTKFMQDECEEHSVQASLPKLIFICRNTAFDSCGCVASS